jgi:secreted Zn-dependent insulinase-like peptidase
MLSEHLRELKYMAQCAGIVFEQFRTGEAIGFTMNSYNQKYHSFFEKAFKEVQTFTPSEDFFNSKRDAFIRLQKNFAFKEPYERADASATRILKTSTFESTALMNEAENLSFEVFLRLREQWFNSLNLTWLIQGHISETDALKIVEIAEISLKHKPVSLYDCHLRRIVLLRDRTVYEWHETNADPKNPNSFCRSMF